MLRIQVISGKGHEQFEHEQGPLEFGRGPARLSRRHVIDDPFVSRDQLRIEEMPGGSIHVENLSWKRSLDLSDGGVVGMGEARELAAPLTVVLGETQILIEHDPTVGSLGDVFPQPTIALVERPDEMAKGLVAVAALDRTPLRRVAGHAAPPPTSAPPEQLAEWLHTIVELQEAAAGSAEFFQRTAQSILDLVGMDLAMVLLAQGDAWKVVAAASARSDVTLNYSRTLVEYVARNRQTFYRDLELLTKDAVSLLKVEAAVAAPVFGLNGEVAGVLYGARDQGLISRGLIGPVEAQLVQLLAAAVGANLARATALRTRVQFEQFFSPELVRELEQNPHLLEGRSQDVTLLFSDLRGFTRLSQRLGAEKTCVIVRDMMERLSEQIVTNGGVIVDYAGDGILAMWNAPTEQPDHAIRACRAALAMLDELPQLNKRWEHEGGDVLSLGIGINSGPAQVGNTGSSRKFKYGPHGHTVNLASRVEEATKKLGLPLLITDSVRNQLPPGMHTRRLGQVRLPGVEQPVVLYELQAEDAPSDWLRLRETYEEGLTLYESGEWSKACQTIAPLLPTTGGDSRYDIPTLKLLRRSWECLEVRPDPFEPIIEVSTK